MRFGTRASGHRSALTLLASSSVILGSRRFTAVESVERCASVCGIVEVACSQLCAKRSALLQHGQGLNKSRQHHYLRFTSDGAFYFTTAVGDPITAQSSML